MATYAYDPRLVDFEALAAAMAQNADSSAPTVDFLSYSRESIAIGNEYVRAEAATYTPADGVAFEKKTIASEDSECELYIYRPEAVKKPLPVVLYCHGGAFSAPAALWMMKIAERIALQAECVVIMPEYKIALDYAFPAGFNDCWNTLEWIAQNPAELNADVSKIAVYGESAGGALAAAVAQKARDTKSAEICYQMLIYPMTDDRTELYPSIKDVDKGYVPAVMVPKMWEMYLRDGDKGMLAYAAPMRAQTLAGLPAAYVEPHEFDCFRDEGIAYAQRLSDEGVSVELNVMKGGYHGCDSFSDNEYVGEIIANRARLLKKALHG